MQTKRLIQSGALYSGDIRHFSAWEFNQMPRLERPAHPHLHDAVYRRQRAQAPVSGRSGGLIGILRAIGHKGEV
jgi:hypothetical protein